jgi:hypothetical protein
MRLQWNERRSSHIADLLAQDLCELAYRWILEQQSERQLSLEFILDLRVQTQGG